MLTAGFAWRLFPFPPSQAKDIVPNLSGTVPGGGITTAESVVQLSSLDAQEEAVGAAGAGVPEAGGEASPVLT